MAWKEKEASDVTFPATAQSPLVLYILQQVHPKSQLKDSWKNLESIFGSRCSAAGVRKTPRQEIRIKILVKTELD